MQQGNWHDRRKRRNEAGEAQVAPGRFPAFGFFWGDHLASGNLVGEVLRDLRI